MKMIVMTTTVYEVPDSEAPAYRAAIEQRRWDDCGTLFDNAFRALPLSLQPKELEGVRTFVIGGVER